MSTNVTPGKSTSNPASSVPETPTTPSSTALAPVQARRKRNQVARACESCRIHRLKCDDHFPCRNCTKRGIRCKNDGATRLSTLPQAHREIEALRQKVERLEVELSNARCLAHNTESRKAEIATIPPQLRPGSFNIPGPDLASHPVRSTKSWNGIYIRTARSQQTTWFGPSSCFCFIGRVSDFLNKSLHLTHSAVQMLPDSASKRLFAIAASSEGEDSTFESTVHIGDRFFRPNSTTNYLSSTQEEYFLNLYWQTYHVIYPVFNETEFKKHYQSLWTAETNERKPSALVEIVVALSLQYGMALSPNAPGRSSTKGQFDRNDATIAGRWYYQRCQDLLATELETPTLATLQCHILCSIYLCCGSFINMSDGACGLAVRTAYMIGLHMDPPASMRPAERELRRRLWWILYVLESKMSMKLGRPFLLHGSSSTCALPADDPDVAASSGSSFARLEENSTWLTYTQQSIKLLLVSRAAHMALYEHGGSRSTDTESQQSGDAIWDDPVLLETYACSTSSAMEHLSEWVQAVPSSLRTARHTEGGSFSTDLTRLEIEQFAPLWVQRQRLILELLYHNLNVNLCRPFISFTPKSATSAPTLETDRLATNCAAHAVAFTHIMYQILHETSILTGWNEAFQWQWNSAVTLVGFVLSQPRVEREETIVNARRAIGLAVSNLEKFGESFAIATSAAGIIKNLSGILNNVVPRERVEQRALWDGRQNLHTNTNDAFEIDQANVLQGHNAQRPQEGDLLGYNAPWVGSGTMGNTTSNIVDSAPAPLLEGLGQSVNSMFGVEAFNSFDGGFEPDFQGSDDALPWDWNFTEI